MPLLKCTISAHPGLPKSPRFWDVVRVDPRARIISLDPYQEEVGLLNELQRRHVISNRAPLKNYRIEKAKDEDAWRLVYVVGKKPAALLEIKPPPDYQLELFSCKQP